MQKEPQNNWAAYYDWQKGRDPRPLFLNALARFNVHTGDGRDRLAIDLGCGDGAETLALLEGGWRVLAIDREQTAVTLLQSKVSPRHQPRLETRVASFADNLDLPPADFIYAGYSLPFCPPSAFDDLWRTIMAALRPGGRFAGQLFGVRDSWAKNPNLTFHTAVQVEQLLNRDLIVEFLREREEDGEAIEGAKHWHQFHIIARNGKL
jgi:SAM-dependent methyltransferase